MLLMSCRMLYKMIWLSFVWEGSRACSCFLFQVILPYRRVPIKHPWLMFIMWARYWGLLVVVSLLNPWLFWIQYRAWAIFYHCGRFLLLLAFKFKIIKFLLCNDVGNFWVWIYFFKRNTSQKIKVVFWKAKVDLYIYLKSWILIFRYYMNPL